MANDFSAALEQLRSGKLPPPQTIVAIITKAKEIFQSEDNVLELSDPITICGDIHGQLYDLFQLFDTALPNTTHFLFLGDYVDRGGFSLETLLYLLIHKIASPDTFFMLRGNHECRAISREYGFYAECCDRRGCDSLWILCNELFDLMPLAAVIADCVFAVHGGISPHLNRVADIFNMDRVQEVPSEGLFADLLWSDPHERSVFKENTRGSGCCFGDKQVEEFCRINRLQFVVRSHQLVNAGYQWMFRDKFLTVWSAPNYEYRSGNMACIMNYVRERGVKSEIKTFAPMEEAKRQKPPNFKPGYFT
jgi:diadenosine tetraphosphatase ApaH/serine/threonine PP2A family protein phosphatase